jgi:hypothetical protein
MDPSFKSKLEVQSIDSLLKNLRNKEVILDPQYQRGDIWSDKMRSDFIDSILKGIIPTNIILNKELKDGKGLLTCIDGKQRVTTILWFYNNKIPHINYVKQDDSDDYVEVHTYYNVIPEEKEKDIEYLTIPDEQKLSLFLDRDIPIAYYTNLAYEKQVDIFSRINHCVKATHGEILISRYSNDAASKKLKEFFESNKFASDNIRKDNYEYIFMTMYMIHNKNLKILKNNTPQCKKFIEETNDYNVMEELVKNCKNIVDIYYSNHILTNKRLIKLPLIKNFKIAMSYLIYNNFKKYDIIDYTECILLIIEKLWSYWDNKYKKTNTRNCGTDASLKILETEYKIMHKKYLKSNDQIDTDEDDNDEDDIEDNDDIDNTESDEKPIKRSIPLKKNNIIATKKVRIVKNKLNDINKAKKTN